MSLWGIDAYDGNRPRVISGTTIFLSLFLHVAGAFFLFVVAWVNGLFEPKETVIPIDLTVIVNENLNGVENEPPPVLNPPPPPPKPPKQKPKPKPKVKPPEPPKALEQIVTNVVKTVEKKDEKKEEKKPEKKEEKKKDPPKKDEPPKKSKEELMKERLEKMRQSAVKNKNPVKIEVKDAKKSGNGKTQKQNLTEAQIRDLLNQGYRPGPSNQISNDELSRCVSLIRMAMSDQWDKLAPKVGAAGDVYLTCRLNSSGGLVNVTLSKSCGDKLSDQAALSVARSVRSVRGLSDSFISKHMKESITIRYTVQGR